jgi:hypothetical protein
MGSTRIILRSQSWSDPDDVALLQDATGSTLLDLLLMIIDFHPVILMQDVSKHNGSGGHVLMNPGVRNNRMWMGALLPSLQSMTAQLAIPRLHISEGLSSETSNIHWVQLQLTALHVPAIRSGRLNRSIKLHLLDDLCVNISQQHMHVFMLFYSSTCCLQL